MVKRYLKKSKSISITLLIVGLGLLILGTIQSANEDEGEVAIEIIKRDKLMPAAHNVYANPNALNGKYYLFKATITNKTKKSLKNLSVKYRIPGYIEWTELELVGKMFKNQSTVVLCYPKFDSKITEKTTESIETVEILIDWDGSKNNSLKETFDFKLADRNEFIYTNLSKDEISGWSDIFDNTVLLPCFVTPNDPVVQYYTQNIQEKILRGEKASIGKKPEEAIRFLMGIYEATLKSGMVYSSVKGIPSNLKDNSQYSQYNRLPREVITGNTGLCLELSLLYASVLSNAGLEPIIFMIPGHAFPGVIFNGSYYAIEATGIGGEGIGGRMSTEKAFEYGMKELNDFFDKAMIGDPKYNIIDIVRLNQEGVTAMYLPNDNFLKEKVDQIASRWVQKSFNIVGKLFEQNYFAPSADLSFNIPHTWEVNRMPDASFPVLTAQVTSPDNQIVANVFDFPGISSDSIALSKLKIELSKNQKELEFLKTNEDIDGIIITEKGNFKWIGKTISSIHGMRFVMIGTDEAKFEENKEIINELYESIKK